MTKLRLFVILSLWRSIHKFKVYLKFFGFFAVACALQPVGSPFCQRLKMTKMRRHCEQILQKFAWQSINLNANLPLDCHEFARLRFANSRNDEFLVILSFRKKAKYP